MAAVKAALTRTALSLTILSPYICAAGEIGRFEIREPLGRDWSGE